MARRLTAFFLIVASTAVVGVLACTSTATHLPSRVDAGGDTEANDASPDVVSDCALQPGRLCAPCISAKCCQYEHFCTAADPGCTAYSGCLQNCSDDAAACNCYESFPDFVAMNNLRAQCEEEQCVNAGLCD